MEENKSVVKVFSVKDGAHHYYVQEMPGLYGLNRDFAIMKDRERFYYGRMRTKREAVAWLLKRLLIDMGQRSIDLHS